MAEDLNSRMDEALGPALPGRLSEIADDPRRTADIGEPTVGDAKRELSVKCKAPIICRMVNGHLTCVSPARRVAALRLAAAEGYGPDECSYRLVAELPDDAADIVSEFVSTWLAQRTSEPEWRERVLAMHSELAKLEGEPWMKTSGWRFAGGICGSHTSAFMRVKGVQERAVPEVLAKVDAGKMGLWSAYELSQLEAGEQRRILEASEQAGGKTITELVREAKAPVMTVAEIKRQIERLTDAVRVGKAEADVAETAGLQAAANDLMTAAIGIEHFEYAVVELPRR